MELLEFGSIGVSNLVTLMFSVLPLLRYIQFALVFSSGLHFTLLCIKGRLADLCVLLNE